MSELELISVPYNSAGRSGGVAAGPNALRAAGLTGALSRYAELTDQGAVDLRADSAATRGVSGLLAEAALTEMVEAVRDRVVTSLRAGRFPLLVGGDCPVLLGGLAALREWHGSAGVLFVDGHEDAWPPSRSTTGEAADCELGLALGRHTTQLPRTLAARLPLLAPDAVVAVGPRDEQDLVDNRVESLDGLITVARPAALHVAHTEGTLGVWITSQATRLVAAAGRWWLHVDLDVLATNQLAAVDYPQPGGLSWAELDVITTAALNSAGCAGWSVCIYNPDLDPDGRDAGRIVDHLGRAIAARYGPPARAGGRIGAP